MKIEYFNFEENFVNFIDNIALTNNQIILLDTCSVIYNLPDKCLNSSQIIKLDNNKVPNLFGITKMNWFRILSIEENIIYEKLIFDSNDFITYMVRLEKYNNTIIFGSSKGNILFFNLNKKEVSAFFQAHNGYINDIKVYLNDGFFYTCGEDQFLKKWNLYNQNCYQTYIGFNQPIISKIQKINQFLFFTCLNNTLSIKNEADNKQYIILDNHENEKYLVDFIPFKNMDTIGIIKGSQNNKIYFYTDIKQNDSIKINTKLKNIQLLYFNGKNLYFASRYCSVIGKIDNFLLNFNF